MLKQSTISVLLPVYNGEVYLAAAIESILAQKFTDFELIVVDDGSDDHTPVILQKYCLQDERIRVVQQSHKGLVTALNRGLDEAKGKYLARMDADDICLPDRFGKQLEVMEADPDLIVAGSAYYLASETGKPGKIIWPPGHDTAIRAALLFDNPFAHSSVMIRLDLLNRMNIRYNAEQLHAEDYELWSRLLHFGKGINLELPLIIRRIHTKQVSELVRDECLSKAVQIARQNLLELGFDLPTQVVEQLRDCQRGRISLYSEEQKECQKLMFEIFKRFEQQSGLDPVQIRNIRGRYCLRLGLAKTRKIQDRMEKLRLLEQSRLSDVVGAITFLLCQFQKAVQQKQNQISRFKPEEFFGQLKNRWMAS